MELYQLEQFKVAAELSHITKAAQVLSISQPALSKNIRSLEKELGYPLFDHIGKNIQLNGNGKILLDCVNEIQTSLSNARRRIREENENRSASISLCVKAASKLLPEILMDYSRKYPGTHFSVCQSQNSRPDHCAFDFTIDASLAPADNDDHSCTLLREQILIALPAGHPLARNISVTLGDLKGESFISLQKGMGLADITQYYCHLSGFEPNIVFESDNPSTVRSLIQLGLGLAFIPAATWPGIADETIRLLPIQPLQCFRYINLLWPKGRYLTPAALSFKSFLTDYFFRLNKGDLRP